MHACKSRWRSRRTTCGVQTALSDKIKKQAAEAAIAMINRGIRDPRIVGEPKVTGVLTEDIE